MTQFLEGAFFGVAPTPEPVVLFDPKRRAELSVATLLELGIKGFEDTERRIEEVALAFKGLHERLVAEDPTRSDSPEPFIGITLTDQYGLRDLVTAFNQKQGQPATHVETEIWNQFSAQELNRRFTTRSGKKVADSGIFLPLAMLRGASNDIDDNGLYYVNQTDKEQLLSAGSTPLLNPADHIIVNAQRRAEGECLLSQQSGCYSRFVQLARKDDASGRSWRPAAYAVDDRFRLDCSNGVPSGTAGVRILGGVDIA